MRRKQNAKTVFLLSSKENTIMFAVRFMEAFGGSGYAGHALVTSALNKGQWSASRSIRLYPEESVVVIQ